MNNQADSSENQRLAHFPINTGKEFNKGRLPSKHNRSDKRQTCRKVAEYFQEYCEYSSIHGIKYIGEKNRSVVERIIWIAVVLTVTVCSTLLILKVYEKWTNSPVIVTFSTTETPISDIPFPAITICPEVKSRPSVFNFSDVLLKKLKNVSTTEQEDTYFDTFFTVCGDYDLYKPFGGQDAISESAVTTLLDVLPNSVLATQWSGHEHESNVLAKVYTDAGVCHTFNMLDIQEVLVNPSAYMMRGSIENTTASRWSIDNGYEDGFYNDTYPRRTFVPGNLGGFQIMLITNKNHKDHICRESFQGYTVTLHNPAEIPDTDQHFRVSLDSAVHARVTPKLITVSNELRSYAPEKRKCYFSNEQSLHYFKSYTQTNCMLECFTNYTYETCGCVFNYMPKNAAMSVCGPGKAECLQKVRANYYMYHAESRSDKKATTCNCLPSCTSLNYDSETSESAIEIHKMLEMLNINNDSMPFDFKKHHVSALRVYFKELQFMSTSRQELYGYVDFLANCGGLLGLFMGFSATSLVEIIYFLSLRIFCNVTHYGRRRWFGKKDIDEDKPADF